MNIVTTHKNTDFDALASVFAATLIHPGAVPVLPRAINPNIRGFLSIHKDLFDVYHPSDIDLARVRRLIVVDVNRWDRLEGMDALKNRNDIEIEVWDHHEGESDIDAGFRCQEATGACVTLLMRRIRERRLLFTPMQATLFLAGIYEDTGNLTFNGTCAEDAYAAAYLLERRADLGVLNNFLRPTYGPKQKDMLYEMLQTAERIHVRDLSVSINLQEIAGHVDRLAVVVRMYRQILNVDAAIGIFTDEAKGRSMVIGRSRVDDLDIGSIMRGLGGGGHPGAGSATLKGVRPEVIHEMVLELVRGNQQASVRISDLMSYPVFFISPETSMREAAGLLRRKGCTGMPVVDGERIKGVLSRRDFRKIKDEKRLDTPVSAYMSTHVVSVESGISPMQAARLMIKHDIGRLPVVDGDGKLIGIVTRSDVMTYFYDLLPD